LQSVVTRAIKRAKGKPVKHKKKKIKITHNNEDLIRLLETAKAKIRVVGIGGGGCNTIERMTEGAVVQTQALERALPENLWTI
jgi:cell division protein FtsZ